jgi:hypothetical protein
MEQTLENKNKAIVLEAFDTLSTATSLRFRRRFVRHPDQMRADNCSGLLGRKK